MSEGNVLHVETDRIRQMLASGWTVEGYSTVIMAAGAMTHSILLRNGDELVSANTTTMISAAGWGAPKAVTGFLSYTPKR